jgi:adenylate cyclase
LYPWDSQAGTGIPHVRPVAAAPLPQQFHCSRRNRSRADVPLPQEGRAKRGKRRHTMTNFDSLNERSGGKLLVFLVVVLLAGLPLAVWLDLRLLSAANLQRQANDLNTAITDIRDFYAADVVGHVLSAHTRTVVTPNFQTVPGAIPIPATFSLELGRVIGANQSNLQYRFVSDFPFKHRAAHQLDGFEVDALRVFRAQPARRQLVDVSWHGWDNRVRFVAPIIMGQTCVACHNSHPDSPKRDWKIGDVRGIQEISIVEPVAANIFSFNYLLIYFGFAGSLAFGFIAVQRRQARIIRRANAQLAETNDFLASISSKISRYLSPQIYKSIFSGEKDVKISTERKKLTIFFSDIKDFTSTTERLQPEELTSLLNEYFTEMSTIAFAHGGTVDKFVGDAIIVFFGDPHTLGVAEDAKACLRMAVAMQVRLAELNVMWHSRGVAMPFRVRMGINTGFCDVGNFGSEQRMDYTIIGAAMNLSARLQTLADPGTIVVSAETFTLVRDIVAGHPLPAVTVRGFRDAIVPYVIDALLEAPGRQRHVFAEHAAGLDLYLDLDRVEDGESERLRGVLSDALDALERRRMPAPEL